MEFHQEATVGLLMLIALIFGTLSEHIYGPLFTMGAIFFVLWLFSRSPRGESDNT